MSRTGRTPNRATAYALAFIWCLGCAPSVPPAALVPREATTVAAPIGKAWNAVVDAFAADNIPIRNMDRASGFISTDALAVPGRTSEAFADCGKIVGLTIAANKATYNVVVRGDSTRATVKATVRFTAGDGTSFQECTSNGRWESAFEAKIKAHAEGKPPT